MHKSSQSTQCAHEGAASAKKQQTKRRNGVVINVLNRKRQKCAGGTRSDKMTCPRDFAECTQRIPEGCERHCAKRAAEWIPRLQWPTYVELWVRDGPGDEPRLAGDMFTDTVFARLVSPQRQGTWHPIRGKGRADWDSWLPRELRAWGGQGNVQVNLQGDSDVAWPTEDPGKAETELVVSGEAPSPRLLQLPWYLSGPHTAPSLFVVIDLAGHEEPLMAEHRVRRIVDAASVPVPAPPPPAPAGPSTLTGSTRAAFLAVFRKVQGLLRFMCKHQVREGDSGTITWAMQRVCGADMAMRYLARNPEIPRSEWDQVAVAGLALAFKAFSSEEECGSRFSLVLARILRGLHASESKMVEHERRMLAEEDFVPCARYATLRRVPGPAPSPAEPFPEFEDKKEGGDG